MTYRIDRPALDEFVRRQADLVESTPLPADLADLLPRDARVRELLPVRLHTFDAAVERALREWETTEELRAR